MIVKAVRHFGGKGAAASFPSPLGGLVLLHLGLGSNPTSLEPPPPSPPPGPRWPARTPSCSYPSRRGRQPMYNWPKVGGKRIITQCRHAQMWGRWWSCHELFISSRHTPPKGLVGKDWVSEQKAFSCATTIMFPFVSTLNTCWCCWFLWPVFGPGWNGNMIGYLQIGRSNNEHKHQDKKYSFILLGGKCNGNVAKYWMKINFPVANILTRDQLEY